MLPGTVRFNLLLGISIDSADRDGAESDRFAIAALEATELWELIESRGGLDSELTSDTLSQGQMQLFALARTILRKNFDCVMKPRDSPTTCVPRILILDEATSHLDAATDARIQSLIKNEFQGFTVLIVAHRVKTMAHADKVIVLDNGRLMREGSFAEVVGSGSSNGAIS